MKAFSTFVELFAEVSMNAMPRESANSYTKNEYKKENGGLTKPSQ
jgi:hypothetical protein